MEKIIIRPAELTDTPQIAKVHVKTWQCAYSGQLPDTYLQSLSIKQRAKRWQEILTNPQPLSKTFVAELDEKVVGFTSAGQCRDEDMPSKTGELWAIYVHPNNMGKGVGSALLKLCLDYLKKLGFNKVILWVLTSNEKTRKWYESKNWQVEGKTRIDSRDNIKLHETRYIVYL